jgi:hypothetical protein
MNFWDCSCSWHRSSEAETVDLQPGLLHMENMKDKTKSVVSHNNINNYYNNYSYNYRFQAILLLFRLGARPFIAHSRSITNTVYNVVTLGCVYITGVGLSWMRSFIDTSWLTLCRNTFYVLHSYSSHEFTSRSGKLHYNVYALERSVVLQLFMTWPNCSYNTYLPFQPV